MNDQSEQYETTQEYQTVVTTNDDHNYTFEHQQSPSINQSSVPIDHSTHVAKRESCEEREQVVQSSEHQPISEANQTVYLEQIRDENGTLRYTNAPIRYEHEERYQRIPQYHYANHSQSEEIKQPIDETHEILIYQTAEAPQDNQVENEHEMRKKYYKACYPQQSDNTNEPKTHYTTLEPVQPLTGGAPSYYINESSYPATYLHAKDYYLSSSPNPIYKSDPILNSTLPIKSAQYSQLFMDISAGSPASHQTYYKDSQYWPGTPIDYNVTSVNLLNYSLNYFINNLFCRVFLEL